MHGAQVQGKRDYQEDRYVCLPEWQPTKRWALALLCDGHGGGEVATFVVRTLPDMLARDLRAHKHCCTPDVHPVIRRCFQKLDDILERNALDMGRRQGCTVSLVLFDLARGDACVAHAGDSRVLVLDRCGNIVATVDHTSKTTVSSSERASLRRKARACAQTEDCSAVVELTRGDYVSVRHDNGAMESLQPTRVIGDLTFKRGVAERLVRCDPDILHVPSLSTVQGVCVASDGLYEVLRNEEVLQLARMAHWSAKQTVQTTLARAVARDVHDNCTVVFVSCS